MKKAGVFLFFVLLSVEKISNAQSLYSLYGQAAAYDDKYQSAKYLAASTSDKAAQSYALMRPTVDATTSLGRERDEFPILSQENTPLGNLTASSGARGVESYSQYNSQRQIGLQVKQSIFNAQNLQNIRQSDLSIETAEIDLLSAHQDLISKLSQAYFDLLTSMEAKNQAEANEKAAEAQENLAKRQYELGKTTITDEREVAAKWDTAKSQNISAANDLKIKQISLDRLVGKKDVIPLEPRGDLYLKLKGLLDRDWSSQLNDSLSIRKALLTDKAAEISVDQAKAGHLPTLDLAANVSRSHNSLSTYTAPSGNTTISSISLQLNLPLFHGLSTQNLIKQYVNLKLRTGGSLQGFYCRSSASLIKSQLIAIKN